MFLGHSVRIPIETIKVMFLYFNMRPSVMLDSHYVHLRPYHFLLPNCEHIHAESVVDI